MAYRDEFRQPPQTLNRPLHFAGALSQLRGLGSYVAVGCVNQDGAFAPSPSENKAVLRPVWLDLAGVAGGLLLVVGGGWRWLVGAGVVPNRNQRQITHRPEPLQPMWTRVPSWGDLNASDALAMSHLVFGLQLGMRHPTTCDSIRICWFSLLLVSFKGPSWSPLNQIDPTLVATMDGASPVHHMRRELQHMFMSKNSRRIFKPLYSCLPHVTPQ